MHLLHNFSYTFGALRIENSSNTFIEQDREHKLQMFWQPVKV